MPPRSFSLRQALDFGFGSPNQAPGRAQNPYYEPCPFHLRKAMLHRFNFANLWGGSEQDSRADPKKILVRKALRRV
jgi:hypothetical protein